MAKLPQFDEKHWNWIVPVILFVGLVFALAFCDPRIARAADPAPAPTPTPLPTPEIDISWTTLLLVGLFFAGIFALMYRNMKKHQND